MNCIRCFLNDGSRNKAEFGLGGETLCAPHVSEWLDLQAQVLGVQRTDAILKGKEKLN